MRKTHRARRGRGKFTDFLRKANDWLRKTHIVSGVANALGSAGVPYASTVGSVAGKLGYGRRRRVHRSHMPRVHHVIGLGRRRVHRRGKGVKQWLSKANDWLKKNRVVSTVAQGLANSGVLPKYTQQIAHVADKLGYGRKRVHHRRMHHTTVVHRGMGRRRHHTRRGYGYPNPQSGIGIAGQTLYSNGLIRF